MLIKIACNIVAFVIVVTTALVVFTFTLGFVTAMIEGGV